MKSIINVGKIKANKLKSLIMDIEWKGKTFIEFRSFIGLDGQYKEEKTKLTECFGDCDPAIIDFLNNIYSAYPEINESNYKEVILSIQAYSDSYSYVEKDIRQTEEELKRQIIKNQEVRAENEKANAIKEAEIKASGNLTQSEKINLGTKEIAKRIRDKLKEQFKNCTFSVKMDSYSGGSSISVYLMEADFKVFMGYSELSEDVKNKYLLHNHTEEQLRALCNSTHAQLSKYSFRDEYDPETWNNGHFLTEKAYNILKEVVKISDYYNYDDSDPMTDYYSVNFSFDLAIGKWDKPFKIIEKLENKPLNDPDKNEGFKVMDFTIKKNEDKNGIEIYFKSKPSLEVLNTLKSNGFRWGRYNKCWYRKYTLGIEEQIQTILNKSFI